MANYCVNSALAPSTNLQISVILFQENSDSITAKDDFRLPDTKSDENPHIMVGDLNGKLRARVDSCHFFVCVV
jgi:hypothetical protein